MSKRAEMQYRIESAKGKSREEWLAMRRSGIGGSDAAAVLGVNPYRSAYAVWADKQGHSAEEEDNEAMRQGRDLEEYVTKRFCEATGKRVVRGSAMYRSKRWPWMTANVDRRIVGEECYVGLECKTTSAINLARYKNGEYPIEYYTQCMHYMAVTGAKKWYLCVLVYQHEPLIYEIERDEDDVKELVEREELFWAAHVVNRIPPPVDGSKSTKAALGRMYIKSNGSENIAMHEEKLAQICAIRKRIRELYDERTQLENEIKEEMGEAERINGIEYSAEWKVIRKTRFEKRLLKSEHPEIDISRYEKQTGYRRFSVINHTIGIESEEGEDE